MTFLRHLGCIVLTAFCLASAGCDRYKSQEEADFDKGFAAFRAGDYFNALRYLTPLAQQGHPGSQIVLGRMYALGEGVPQDPGQAEAWLNAAAKKMNRDLEHAEVAPVAEKPMGDILMKTLNDAVADRDGSDMQALKQDFNAKMLGKVIQQESQKEVTETIPAFVPTQTNTAATTPEALSGTVSSVDELTVRNLRERANQGDRTAVHLLIEAYKKGLYGLTPDADKLSYYRQRAIYLASHTEEKSTYTKIRDWFR